jgi:hypothetical protein
MASRLPGLVAVLVVGVLLAAGAGGAAGQVTMGEPDLNVYLPENEVTAGSESELAVQIQNDAEVESGQGSEAVTTARAVRARVTDDGPFDVRTREQPVGPIPDGSVSAATFRVVVPDDVDPGTYDVDVRVRYSVTNLVTSETSQRVTRSTTETITVRVVDEARFEITDVESDVQPGTTGETTLTVENVGSETATGARGTFTGSETLVLDGGSAEAFLGELEPGEDRTVTVDTAIDSAVAGGEKPIEASFQYRDADGRLREYGPTTAALGAADAQSFAIEDLEDTLSVGYDGEIRGTFRNDGPQRITDGVLLLEPATESLSVSEGRYALPELDTGEATEFSFPTEVGGQADPGPRQVRFSVEYANGGRSTTTAGPVSERVVVEERSGEFNVTAEDATVAAGETTDLVLTITNERPETLSNVDARLYADGDLSAPNDEAFVDELAPGDSAELRFRVSASGGAMAKAHPVELDFQYDTENGESKLSRTYQQPVEVVEPSDGDGGLAFAPVVGALAVLTALGAVRRWRRR